MAVDPAVHRGGRLGLDSSGSNDVRCPVSNHARSRRCPRWHYVRDRGGALTRRIVIGLPQSADGTRPTLHQAPRRSGRAAAGRHGRWLGTVLLPRRCVDWIRRKRPTAEDPEHGRTVPQARRLRRPDVQPRSVAGGRFDCLLRPSGPHAPPPRFRGRRIQGDRLACDARRALPVVAHAASFLARHPVHRPSHAVRGARQLPSEPSVRVRRAQRYRSRALR